MHYVVTNEGVSKYVVMVKYNQKSSAVNNFQKWWGCWYVYHMQKYGSGIYVYHTQKYMYGIIYMFIVHHAQEYCIWYTCRDIRSMHIYLFGRQAITYMVQSHTVRTSEYIVKLCSFVGCDYCQKWLHSNFGRWASFHGRWPDYLQSRD